MNINIKKYLVWAAAGFTFIISLAYATSSDIFSAIFFLLCTLLIVPQTYQILDSVLKNKLSNNNLRILLIIILFFVGVAIPSSSNTAEPVQQSIETGKKENPVDSETLNNEKVINEAVDPEQNNDLEIGKVVKVSDGDTIRVEIENDEVSVRLIGIDTPEINHQSEPVQCYGPEAKEALENLILNKEVRLEKDVSDVDKYDRYLRYIWLDEILVNEYMTQQGYALASPYPPDIKYQQRINTGEQTAKNNSVGFWSVNTCNGNVYTGTYKDPNKTTTPEPQTNSSNNTNTGNVAPPVYVSPVVTQQATPPPTTSSKYTCSCSKTCGQMASCEEAYFQLNECGCSARDGDDDGVPCESICR